MSASQQSDGFSGSNGSAKALVMVDRGYDGLAMVTSPAEALRRFQELQAFCRSALVRDVDYGQITDTQKPCLYQPGAQKLCELYGFSQDFEADTTVEDWERGFFFYRKRCVLLTRKDGRFAGAGIGSCNSKEDRYAGRWVYDDQVPAGLDVKTLKRRSGMSRNNRPYVQYKVPNEDLFSLVNTIEKMACKRALIHAVLGVTRMSGMFTQDVEDLPRELLGDVDDVRPWETGDAVSDLDAVANGFKATLDLLTSRKAPKAEFDALAQAIAVSPLGAEHREVLKKHFAACLDKLRGSSRSRAKTDEVAAKVAEKNAAARARTATQPNTAQPAAKPAQAANDLQDPGYDPGPDAP